MLDKSCWRTEQRDAAQSPLEVPVVPFITVTIDTHTRTHTCTRGHQWVYSYILSLHSVKGKISIPDLHKYTQTHLSDSLLGCFWLQEGLERARGLCWMHPWSSLFTQNMKININTDLFDASPCCTFICKTEQLGWTESVCLCLLSGECVCSFVYISLCMCLCTYISSVCQTYCIFIRCPSCSI